MANGLANGTLKPVIDKTFPLENIVGAHRYLESNQHVGKVVVTVGDHALPPVCEPRPA